MLTGQQAWDWIKTNKKFIGKGFQCFYRSGKSCDFKPINFHWAIYRKYYYEHGKDTGRHGLEICLGDNHFLWENNKFDVEQLGIDFVNYGENI